MAHNDSSEFRQPNKLSKIRARRRWNTYGLLPSPPKAQMISGISLTVSWHVAVSVTDTFTCCSTERKERGCVTSEDSILFAEFPHPTATHVSLIWGLASALGRHIGWTWAENGTFWNVSNLYWLRRNKHCYLAHRWSASSNVAHWPLKTKLKLRKRVFRVKNFMKEQDDIKKNTKWQRNLAPSSSLLDISPS